MLPAAGLRYRQTSTRGCCLKAAWRKRSSSPSCSPSRSHRFASWTSGGTGSTGFLFQAKRILEEQDLAPDGREPLLSPARPKDPCALHPRAQLLQLSSARPRSAAGKAPYYRIAGNSCALVHLKQPRFPSVEASINDHINTHTHRTLLLTLRSRPTQDRLLRGATFLEDIHELLLSCFIDAQSPQQRFPGIILDFDFDIDRAWPSRLAMRYVVPQLCDLILKL